jgi:hypothetical protein
MSTKTSTDLNESAGGARSEPGGRAQRPAGKEPLELPNAIRDRLADGPLPGPGLTGSWFRAPGSPGGA